jgi:hypothetical protein
MACTLVVDSYQYCVPLNWAYCRCGTFKLIPADRNDPNVKRHIQNYKKMNSIHYYLEILPLEIYLRILPGEEMPMKDITAIKWILKKLINYPK